MKNDLITLASLGCKRHMPHMNACSWIDNTPCQCRRVLNAVEPVIRQQEKEKAVAAKRLISTEMN